MDVAIQSLVSGLLIGGVYALVATGLNLMFGVMKIVNFALGEFLMVGMYVAVGLAGVAVPGALLGVYWVVIPTTVVMSGAGVLFFFLMLRRAARFGEGAQILLTLGLSIFLQGVAQVVEGSDFKLVRTPVYGKAIHPAGLTIGIAQLVAFTVAIAVTAVMAWAIRYTHWGKTVRAVSESAEISQTLGINARTVFAVATGVSIGLAGLAGALLMPYQYTFPNVGQSYVVIAFLAIVISGLGNVNGAIAGGLLLGVVQSLTAAYVSLDFSTAAMYVIFLAVLLLRPQGLFTRRMRTV
jgi:branched-chain amino acid transport system permease protein